MTVGIKQNYQLSGSRSNLTCICFCRATLTTSKPSKRLPCSGIKTEVEASGDTRRSNA